MTQRVTTPDGQSFEFPDDMSPADMVSAIDRHNSSTLLDMAKSAAVAPAKAIAGLAGLAGDVRDASAAARNKILSYLPDWATKASNAASFINPTMLAFSAVPTSGQIRGGIESITGPWYDPQTRAGKVADTATQAATTFGRNLLTTPLKSAATIAGITAGTEGAGAATNDNQLARFVGGLLGGGIPAAANAWAGMPGRVVRDAVGDLSPAQVNAAIARQDMALNQGVPLMGTESLDAGHQLASFVRSQPKGAAVMEPFLRARPGQVEGAVNRDILAPTGPRQIPSANAAAAEKAATQALQAAEARVSAQSGPLYQSAANDQVSPEAMRDLLLRAKSVAASDKTGIVSPSVDEFIRRLSVPITESKVLPGAETPSIYQTIDKAITGEPTAQAFRLSNLLESAGSQLYPHGYGDNLPARQMPIATQPQIPYITDIGNLDRARRYFRDKIDLPAFAADAIPKEAGSKLGALNAELRDIMEAASPTFAQARQTHATLSQQQVDPLLASGVGKVAGRGYDPAQFPAVDRVVSTVANDNVRPENIRTLYQTLNQQDRQAFPGIVQTHIETQLNRALKDIQSGPNPNAGANFRNAIVGTPQEQANFNEMMRGVAQAHGLPANDVIAGANNLLKTLELTGRTPGIGSPTQPRQNIAGDLSRTMLGDAASAVSTKPLGWLRERVNDMATRGRTAELARVLTAPDSVQQLMRLAKLQPNGLTARYMAASLLGLDNAISGSRQ